MVLLNLGNKVAMEKPINNDSLSYECRHYFGEYQFFIEDCFWELVCDHIIVADCVNSIDAFETTVLHNKIIAIDFIDIKKGNLLMSFDGGAKLYLYIDVESDYTDYTIYTKDMIYSNESGVILKEKN